MAYNFDVKLQTENFEIQVDTAECYGYFEHNTRGDECGGGLWFQIMATPTCSWLELIDYDGVSELPIEVAKALRGAGFIVSEEFD